MTQLVPQVTVGAGTEQDVDALNVAPHARDVERSVGVPVHPVHLAAGVHKLLHHSVVAAVARLVQRVVLVDERAVRPGSLGQQVLADPGAVVAHGPVERRHREALPVLEQVVDGLVHVVVTALEQGHGLSLLTALDSPQELVVLEVVSHSGPPTGLALRKA